MKKMIEIAIKKAEKASKLQKKTGEILKTVNGELMKPVRCKDFEQIVIDNLTTQITIQEILTELHKLKGALTEN